ncbi:hypothetical protein [Rufibacter immobilis]|uniref:hypothetical protein n=1 Tax=Rufibacter immobilis TaxID=1348778 RepID=UPI0035EAF764
MRGHETLFTNLFPPSVSLEAPKQGQRNTQTDRRDDVLAHRYYYWVHLRRNRYDDALAELEKEFFLSAAVVVQRLDRRRELLRELVAWKPNPRQLGVKLPHFNWQVQK